MSEITSNFRAIIISLMIVSGAINTIGNTLLTQPTSSKTNRWSTKGSTTSTFSTPTCKYLPYHPGCNHVLRRSTCPCYLLLHETQRRGGLQLAHARRQIKRKRRKSERVFAGYPSYKRFNNFHTAVRGSQFCGRLSLPNDERRIYCHHFHLLHDFSQNESKEKSSCRQRTGTSRSVNCGSFFSSFR
jgi:hypothetical protein